MARGRGGRGVGGQGGRGDGAPEDEALGGHQEFEGLPGGAALHGAAVPGHPSAKAGMGADAASKGAEAVGHKCLQAGRPNICHRSVIISICRYLEGTLKVCTDFTEVLPAIT